MKLLILLTSVACLQAWSNGHGQTITLSVKDASLESVFKEIRKQSAYSFIYTKEELAGSRPVSLEVKAASIEQVLEICFQLQPLIYTIEEKHIVVKRKKQETNITVSPIPLIDIKGKVTSENGAVLAGATITVKGTNRTTITNENGEFVFSGLQEDAILLISSVGHQPIEYKLNGKNEVAIRLKAEVSELGDVTVKVNTGYQELPKERATGSFTQIDNATLNQQVGSTILPRLDGVASGVLFPKQQLQDGPNFMIRGLSTINGPKNPLIVVDNFPYEGDINNINPNDIESVTILKDAAASSIWGTKAGNGVIVITTKKGKFNQKLKVGFNTNLVITNKPNLSSLRIISPEDYIEVEKFLFNENLYNAYDDLYPAFKFYGALSPVIETLLAKRKGAISDLEAETRINNFKKIDLRDQYEKYVYQHDVIQQYALNLSGGSEKLAYYLSLGYDKNTDQLAGAGRRFTMRSENMYKPLKNLQINIGIQYTQDENKSGRQGYGQLRTGDWQIPYLSLADEQKNSQPVAITYRRNYTDTAGGTKLLDWKYYPLDEYKHNRSKTIRQDLLANIGINYKVLNGLSLNINYFYERQNTGVKTIQDMQSYSARNLVNLFTQLDRATGNITYIVPLGSILGISANALESQNFRGQIDFNRTWNKHSITAFMGSEIRDAQTTGNAATYYGYNENTGTTVKVDLANTYPTFINGSANYIPGGGLIIDKLNRFVSFYANGAYTYNEKYTYSISGRRDASNLFGVATNNKWNPVWSSGVGWNVFKESFYHADWLPYLKLRATYGFSGNTDPSRTAVATLVYNDPQPPTNFSSTRVDQFPNPDLRWEKVRMINVGLDFQIKGEIISGSIEGYLKKGIDLFGNSAYDPTAGLNGVSTIIKNVASMRGKGIDVTINSKNINGSFKWYSQVLFSYNNNRTTDYYVDSNLRSGSFLNDGVIINPIAGKPLYSIATLRWAGLNGSNGDPQGYIGKDISADYYEIVENTRKEDLIYKSSIPVIFGSVINTFSWKGLSLMANISYRLGHYFKKPSINYYSLYNNGAAIGSSDYAKRWQNPGDERNTNVPSAQYPPDPYRDNFYNNSYALVKKADNIKLQYINLSYDFSYSSLKKNPLKGIQLYFNASNLGIIWKANKDAIDPDYISSIPPVGKAFAVGIRANFYYEPGFFDETLSPETEIFKYDF